MIDLLYVLGTIAFFGLMLRYVTFCERIGRTNTADAGATGPRP